LDEDQGTELGDASFVKIPPNGLQWDEMHRCLGLAVSVWVLTISSVGVRAPVEATPQPTMPDAGFLVAKSADVMSALTSLRFVWSMHADQRGGPPSAQPAFDLTVVGDFVAPDRLHAQLSSTDERVMMGLSDEVLIVGDRMWMRSGSELWGSTPINTYGVAIDPTGVRRPFSAEGVSFLRSPVVTSEANLYVITSDWDVERARIPYGMSNYGMVGLAWGLDYYVRQAVISEASDRVTLRIDKATMLLVSINTSTELPIPRIEDGPPWLRRYEVSINYSDFNNPSIVVEAPE